MRVRDDRGARGRKLEGTSRRGAGHRRVRPARDVQVDPSRGDRAREHVEGNVTELARRSGVALEVESAEGEVQFWRLAGRLADHLLHPVAPELVAVAVEEDVDLLLDGLGREELGIRSPEERLRPARSELEEPRRTALRVRDHEVVLERIGAVVRVEARVHPSVLGEAHRDVAVVEDHGDPEAVAERGRNSPQVGHRDRVHDDRVRVLSLDQPLEMTLPARRYEAPDRLAREPVEARVLGLRFSAAEVAVALHACDDVSDGLVRLTLDVGRVRRDSPPRRLDGPPAVGRDDEVDPGLVHPLPQLPPRGRAAVTEVEVDRRGDREDLRRTCAQYAPRPAITAGIVRAMIVMSSQIDQFSRYVKSSRTRSSNVSPERPEICQSPVIPGSTL